MASTNPGFVVPNRASCSVLGLCDISRVSLLCDSVYQSDIIVIQRLSRNQRLVYLTGKNLRGQGTLAQVVIYRPRSPESSFSQWAPWAASSACTSLWRGEGYGGAHPRSSLWAKCMRLFRHLPRPSKSWRLPSDRTHRMPSCCSVMRQGGGSEGLPVISPQLDQGCRSQ